VGQDVAPDGLKVAGPALGFAGMLALDVPFAAADPALIVGIYAAVASTVVGAWQIYSGVQQRRARIEVSTYIGEVHQYGADPITDVLTMSVVNHSDYAMRWTFGAWQQKGDGNRWVFSQTFPYGDPLPHLIPPHDSRSISVELAVLKSLDLSKPIVASAEFSDGKSFKSKPRILRTE
jgi:hypothetical protein